MKIDELTITTHSSGETEALGRALTPLLPPGALIALYGDLATGKTCLVRGIVSALTDEDPVSSPTFTIVNQYNTPTVSGQDGETPFYHLDLYRITELADLAGLGYEELFDLDQGICAIEWAEHAAPLLPPTRLDIRLSHAHIGDDTRTLTLQNHALLPPSWQQHLTTALA